MMPVRFLFPLPLSLSRLSRLSLSHSRACMQSASEKPVRVLLPPKKDTSSRKQVAVPFVH